MTGIFKVEHCPEIGIGIRFRDLIQRRVILVDDLVDGRHHSRILYRPTQISRGLTADYIWRFVALRDGRDGR